MRLTYVVLLKPCEIRFTQDVLAPIFDNGIPLLETLEQLENGEIVCDDIPSIEVVFYQEKWEWYTLNNRRLWVFQALEKQGKITHVKTKRFENVQHILDYPTQLYQTAKLSERSYSFSWRGERLRLNPRDDTSELDEEREHGIKEEEKGNSCREVVLRAKGDVFRRLGSAKSPRRSFKPERYHPYASKSRDSSSQSASGRSRRLSETSGQSTRSTGSRFHLAGCKFSLSEWFRKRSQFFRYIYSLRAGLERRSRMLECLYTCGVCFKSFKAKVSLDQHCVELHHWACVRCGRFFASFTSLGQHKLDVRHAI